MIVITNIRNVHQGQFDEVWAIVRSLKTQTPWMKQVQELSPSWDLFLMYRKLLENNNWNKQTFESLYAPRFLNEMKSVQARSKLNELYIKNKHGLKIALVCFCKDKDLCHRSLISKMLSEKGIDNILS